MLISKGKIIASQQNRFGNGYHINSINQFKEMMKNPFYEIDNIEYDEYILPNYVT